MFWEGQEGGGGGCGEVGVGGERVEKGWGVGGAARCLWRTFALWR